jgi:hypothetical protein
MRRLQLNRCMIVFCSSENESTTSNRCSDELSTQRAVSILSRLVCVSFDPVRPPHVGRAPLHSYRAHLFTPPAFAAASLGREKKSCQHSPHPLDPTAAWDATARKQRRPRLECGSLDLSDVVVHHPPPPPPPPPPTSREQKNAPRST